MSKREEQQAESLQKALVGQSVMNYAAIYEGFMARGIAEADIRPRENVFTYNAWIAAGRQVRKGEHGVKVVTFVDMSESEESASKHPDKPKSHYRRTWTTTVFHVSQTDPITKGA
jgi:antirestriction protein ArdC